MPRGIKVIVTLNILLASVFIANLLFLQKIAAGNPMLVLINLIGMIGAAVLILVALIVLLRLARAVGFARLLIYVLALVLGLQILLTLKYLFSAYGLFVVCFDVIVIVYAIGMRGYLASQSAAQYFIADNPSS